MLPSLDDGAEGGDEMTEDDEGGLHTITEEEEQDELNRSLSQSRLGKSQESQPITFRYENSLYYN